MLIARGKAWQRVQFAHLSTFFFVGFIWEKRADSLQHRALVFVLLQTFFMYQWI